MDDRIKELANMFSRFAEESRASSFAVNDLLNRTLQIVNSVKNDPEGNNLPQEQEQDKEVV